MSPNNDDAVRAQEAEEYEESAAEHRGGEQFVDESAAPERPGGFPGDGLFWFPLQ